MRIAYVGNRKNLDKDGKSFNTENHIALTLAVSFHLDKYAGIERNGGIGEDVFWKTRYVFSPEGSPQSAAIFKSHGINQRYLPAGVFEDECYMAEPVERFKHDVVFIGGGATYSHPEWHGYRRELTSYGGPICQDTKTD